VRLGVLGELGLSRLKKCILTASIDGVRLVWVARVP